MCLNILWTPGTNGLMKITDVVGCKTYAGKMGGCTDEGDGRLKRHLLLRPSNLFYETIVKENRKLVNLEIPV